METANQKHTYKVSFRKGFGSPMTFEAASPLDARKMALVEYRKNRTFVDEWPLDFVVSKDVEEIA